MRPTQFIHYTSGIQPLDDSHWDFVSLLSPLGEAVQVKAYHDVQFLFDEFIDKVSIHITAEEQFMQAINYPYIERHFTNHRSISLDLKCMRLRLVDTYIYPFLRGDIVSTLSDHFDHYDLELAQYVKMNNIPVTTSF